MRKLMIASLAFAVGTAICQYLLPVEKLLLTAVVMVSIGIASFLLKGERRLRCCIIFFSLACAFLYNYVYISAIRSVVESCVSEETHVEAEVLDYGEPTDRRWRIPVRVLGERKITAMYYGDEEVNELAPGDRISGMMTVRDASFINDTPLTSFTAKGYYLMLFSKGNIQMTKDEPSLRYFPKYLAKKMLDTIDSLYDVRYAPFVRAILIGDRAHMTDGQTSELSEAGVYHITAVSGMHCGFLLSMIVFLLGRRRQRLLAAVAIPLLWLYVVVTGCPASMIRAAVMLTMVLLGPLFRRENDAPTALSFALFLLLLENPYAIAGAGLQLSFGAMAGLLLLTPKINAILPGGNHIITGFLKHSVSASFGVMAITAPLTAVYFNNISLISPLANVLILPVASVTFAFCLLSVFAGMLIPFLGAALAAIGGAGVWYISAVARLLARIPCHAVYFTNDYLVYWLIFVLTVFAFCTATPVAKRKYIFAGILSLAMLGGIVYLPVYQRQGKLHLVSVDVGQGASTILASEEMVAVVDCGSSNSYMDAGDRAADTLNTYGYFALDYAILTHYHADHVNGLEVLLSRVETKEILVPLPTEEDVFHEDLVQLAKKYETEISYITEDTDISLGKATLRIFAPVAEGGGNEEGLSVLCNVDDYNALITGDMNRSNEKVLAAEKELPDLEVLMVGHHGAANATSDELLAAAMPEIGIISVGDNSYGHPDQETMQRMVRRGMTIYRTDLQGNISLVVP